MAQPGPSTNPDEDEGEEEEELELPPPPPPPPPEEEEEEDPRKALTQEQVQLFKALFMELDVQGKGKLPVKAIGTALRAIGLNPRQSQIKEHIKKIDPEGKGNTDFQGFLYPIALRLNEVPETPEEIIAAFRVLDTESVGFLESNQLVEYLTTLGETLEDYEIELLLKMADTRGDGNINYEEFVQRMTSVPKKGKGDKGKGKGKDKKKK